MFWGSGPCTRSHASAGHLVVYFFASADRFSTSWCVLHHVHRDGFFYVLGLRLALLYDVAASMVLTVAAAAIFSELDVAASFWLAIAAAALSGGGELAC